MGPIASLLHCSNMQLYTVRHRTTREQFSSKPASPITSIMTIPLLK